MKPLTIEQLKALEVGDWVWVENLCHLPKGLLVDTSKEYQTAYVKIISIEKDYFLGSCFGYYKPFLFSEYEIKWIAYRNKQEAEAKGEIVELPCIVGTDCYVVKKGVMRRMTLKSYKVTTGNFVEVYFSNPKCYITGGRPNIESERDCSMLGLFGKEWFADKSEAERRLEELKGEKK